MNRIFWLILLFSYSIGIAQISFDDYFENKSLRFDYYHGGNFITSQYFHDKFIEEPYWGGSKTQFIDIFNYGLHKIHIVDAASNKIIFTKHYNTLFDEWRMTAQAKEFSKIFAESIVFPYPKKDVIIEIYDRDSLNQWFLNTSFKFYAGKTEVKKDRNFQFPNKKIIYNGESAQKLDIAIIPDGYSAKSMDKFEKDCQRFAQYLFGCKPFDKYKDKINIWAIMAPSIENGTDEPHKNIWKQTIVNCSFNFFGSDRYIMTYDTRSLHDLAANCPYDQIVVLINSAEYGGGGIYNFYATCTSDNPLSNFVFIHEFGHSFAGLADEYIDTELSYNGLYPLHVEPWEPNITTLVNFKAKWESMMDSNLENLKKSKPKQTPSVGLYEGAGYKPKGIYRPAADCSMRSAKYDNFCPVCIQAIEKMLLYRIK